MLVRAEGFRVLTPVRAEGWATSGLSTMNKDQIAERGARMARRDD